MFRCTGREFAALCADKLNGNVYLYNFAHNSKLDPTNLNHLATEAELNFASFASHTSELIFVFFTLVPFQSESDLALGEEMTSRWTNFAKTGNPNGMGYDGRTAVPKDEACNGSVASMPTFLLQSGGGTMTAVSDKVKQCSVLLLKNVMPAKLGNLPYQHTPPIHEVIRIQNKGEKWKDKLFIAGQSRNLPY